MYDPAARQPRSSVILYASVQLDRFGTAECRVRNLSEGGACLDNFADLRVGERIAVTMGGLDAVSAEVMWARGRLAGVRFHAAVDLAAARQPRGRTQVARAGWMADMNHAYRKRA